MTLDLEAIEQIKQLKARYFRGLDTADQPLLRSCFTEDARVAFKGSNYAIDLNGLEEILGFYHQAFHEKAAAFHSGHHPEIQVDSDAATGTWYLHDIFYDMQNKIKREGTAIYQDQYVKQDGEWRIRHSGYERVWERMEHFEDDGKFTARKLAETGRKLIGADDAKFTHKTIKS